MWFFNLELVCVTYLFWEIYLSIRHKIMKYEKKLTKFYNKCQWIFLLFRRSFNETVYLLFKKLLHCHQDFWIGIKRNSRQELFCKKGVFRSFTKFTGKHLCQRLFVNKETLAQVFYREFCEISKNTFSYRTPPVAAPGVSEWIYTLHSFRTPCSK